MNEKELFENFCFLPDWTECDYQKSSDIEKADNETVQNFVPQRKDLTTLLAELEEIKNNIENIKAKEWHLAKLIKFNKEGFSLR